MEQQRLGHTQRLEEIQIAADVAESQALYSYANHSTGSPWVEALQASVRPIITYAFFLVFAVVKVSALATLLQTDGITLTAALLGPRLPLDDDDWGRSEWLRGWIVGAMLLVANWFSGGFNV